MPIVVYTGLPRSGKSYQVVAHVIVAALRQGRRVVTNISGVQYEKIRAHLIDVEKVDPATIGEIVEVTHEQVKDPFFFRTDSDAAREAQQAVLDSDSVVKTFVQPGDLVALDEIWRFWEKRGKIDPRAMNFFRMHGHLVHPDSGLICEVALITQSIRDVNENIRDVVAETYRMSKDTAVGSDKSFLVVVYSRGSEMARDEIRRFKGMYNPAFFEFYKSHSQAQAGSLPKEDKVDKRGNIFYSPFFRYVIPAMLLLSCGAAWYLYSFFIGTQKPAQEAAVPGLAAPANAPSPALPKPSESSEWRVVGYLKNDKGLAFVLADSSGGLRYENRVFDSKIGPLSVSVTVDDQKFDNHKGAKNGKSSLSIPGIN